MKNKLIRKILWSLIISLSFLITLQAKNDLRSGRKINSKVYKVTSTTEGGKKGDAYAINVNNIYMPMNRKGTLADVNVDPYGTLGRYPDGNGEGFLFSGGFFLSGLRNGTIWANAQASASLVEDYLHGDVATGSRNSAAQLYVLQASDEPFSQSWIDWADAVSLGADFYDGDGDGVYNPVDKNGNGEWDADEDRPDLIGDETVWTIYNDAVKSGDRRWNTVPKLGIEIRQTVWGFASAGSIGNLLFIRYRFKYVGLGDPAEPDQLDEVYFGVWADPDVGDATDDLVGVDVSRNAGYVFNDGPDPLWGAAPPCFMIDFFSGPVAYVPGETFVDADGNGVYDEGETTLDTAYSNRGQFIGVEEFPGATNLGISSFVHYMQSDPDLGDPDNKEEARNYMLGLDKAGNPPDPCTWAYGEVLGGEDCATIDPRFWYSGDPVTQTGWINSLPTDQRQMQNTGPFTLKKGEEKEIVVAYVIGVGSDALSSVSEAQRIDDGAQFIFDINFLAPGPPPAVQPVVEASDSFIDITWDTYKQVTYVDSTSAWTNKFEGYLVHAYKTNNTQETIDNVENKMLYTAYDLKDNIADIYLPNPATRGTDLLYAKTDNQLDYDIYSDPELGKIRLRITEDPFTGGPLIKGKPYYFSIESYAINYRALVNRETGEEGLADSADYYLSLTAFTQNAENLPKILPGEPGGEPGIILGQDKYSPPTEFVASNRVQGVSNGLVTYDVLSKADLNGNTYKVEFTMDSSEVGLYQPFWTLTNETTNTVLIDSSKEYLYGNDNVALPTTDGFLMRIDETPPTPAAMVGETSTAWYTPDSVASYYIPNDNAQATPVPVTLPQLGGKLGTYTKSDQLKRIELRFDGGGKAYRYVNGIKGSVATRDRFFLYAEAISADDTAGTGFGKLGEGFVDVPFTAWVEDPIVGESRQLAVGFIERSAAEGGNPDGVWDPDTNVAESFEYIVIFNEDYDPNGNQLVYQGGTWEGARGPVWADLQGGSRFYDTDGSTLSTEDKKKALSPWFDALYVIGLEMNTVNDYPTQGDKFVIDVDVYPYTEKDVYEFTTSINGALTTAEQQDIFDKVNVFPNPLFGFNPATSWTSGVSGNPDEPFVTFSNLPEDITIKIFSLSGQLLRTLNTSDKDSPTSPFLRWDLQNETGLRVASGLYIAIVSSPKFGEKILKFSIVMPQKQIPKY